MTSAGIKMAIARQWVEDNCPYLSGLLNDHVLQALPPDSWCATTAVSKDMVIYFNEKFIEGCDQRGVNYALVHEILHTFFDHAGRAEFIGVPTCNADIHNKACDAQIDLVLKELFGRPWKWLVTCESLGVESNLGTEATYAILAQRRTDQGDKGNKADEGSEQAQPGEGEGKAGGRPCAGQCGSGAGNPLPGEPEAHEQGRLEADKTAAIEAAAQAIAKNPGSVPGALQDAARAVLTPPRVPWSRLLERRARRAVEFLRGFVEPTWTRPHRKQAAYGYGHGSPVVPSWRRPVIEVEIAVDTSGSMWFDPAAMTAVLAEGRGVLEAIRGTRTKVVSIDTQVRAVQEVTDISKVVFKGGGGTAFAPYFDDLNKRRKKPQVVVFFTDGHVWDVPKKPPRGTEFIWVLCGSSAGSPCDWGTQIKIEGE